MGYYETTWARMRTILAHLVAAGQQSAPDDCLTCRAWIWKELGVPLGWSWQATCRAITALVAEGYLTESSRDRPGHPARRKWIGVSDKGRVYYASIHAEDSRQKSASVTAPKNATT